MKNRETAINLFRVLIGLLLIKDFLLFFKHKDILFNTEAIVSYNTYVDIISFYNLDCIYINFNNPILINVYCISAIIFSCLFTLGIFPRLSASILFIYLIIFKTRNIYLLDGGDNVLTAILPFFILTNCKNFFSTPKTKKSFLIQKVNNLAILGIAIQICIIYLFAFLHKLNGESWLNGTALHYILNTEDFSPFQINKAIGDLPILVAFLTWFTLLFQFAFPFLIWINKLKYIMILIGTFFHLGIFFFMRIDNFSYIMIACYTIFLSNNDYLNIQNFIKRYA